MLVLDVARFKYPPYWAKLPLLFEAMVELMTSEGRQWLRQRHMAQPAFRRDNVERAIPVVTKITRHLVALAHALRGRWPTGA